MEKKTGEIVEVDFMDPKVKSFIEGLPANKRDDAAKIFMSYQESYSGPLPSPRDFKGYQEVLADAPERILTMAEKALDHRMEEERLIVASRISLAKVGQWLGFVFGMVLVAAGVVLTCRGFEKIGAGLLFVIVSVLVVFVLGKNPLDNKKRENKQE